MTNPDQHAATIRAALESRRIALVMELSNWLDGHPMRVKYQAEIAAIDAARAELEAAAEGVPDEVREAHEAGMRTEREHQNALSRFVEQKHQEELAALKAASAVEGMPTGWPHSEGYFAFDGRVLGSSVENLQWVVMVRMNKIDNEYYAYRFGGLTLKVTNMIGTWTKLHVPWDTLRPRPATGDGDA